MANEIDRVVPPALPLATEQYNRPYMDQNSNVLRLFFNRLANIVNTLTQHRGGWQVSLCATSVVLQHHGSERDGGGHGLPGGVREHLYRRRGEHQRERTTHGLL